MSHNGDLFVLAEVSRSIGVGGQMHSIMPVKHPAKIGDRVIQDEVEWTVERIVSERPVSAFAMAKAEAYVHA
jgi:hypothetical protein